MHITLVHNPNAGDRNHTRRRLTKLLSAEGYRVRYLSTKEESFLRQMRQAGEEFVVVAGGDGTVTQVAKAAAGRGVPIAVLPIGTANNIARTLGISGSLETLIAQLRTAERRPFDLGLIRGPDLDDRFLEGVGMGLFTEAMCRIDADGDPEELGEKVIRDHRFLRLLTRGFPARQFGITADAEDLSGEYLMCEVLNIRSIGPGIELAPRADPGDGKLDLVLVGEGQRVTLREYLEARQHGAVSPSPFSARPVGEVRIVPGEGGVRVDDEIARSAGRVVISVQRHAIEFLVPGPPVPIAGPGCTPLRR